MLLKLYIYIYYWINIEDFSGDISKNLNVKYWQVSTYKFDNNGNRKT